MDKKLIADVLPHQDVLVSTSLDHSFKNESKNLKGIFMPGAGWEKVSPEAVPDGCLVTNSYEHEIGIAEYVIMSMIALDRNLINVHNNFSKNKWDYWPQRSGPSKELHGRSVGVLGLGRIGRKVLEMTKVFGMKNYGIEVNPIDQSIIEDLSLVDLVKPKDIISVLPILDFFIICVPFIKSTEGLITKNELSLMKKDSFIINPARGPIVNQKDLFESLHSSGREVGSSFAVYKDGKAIVDIWGGYTDKQKTNLWSQDSLATVWSTTKGVAAITCALAVEKGLLDYEEKVSHYWPEFGCNGKEDITVGMLLSHQAGICGSATNEVKDYYSQETMAEELAAMKPIWEPGTASGYHSMTYGWLTSELIIRVTGKTLGTFYADEIGNPNNIDFFIGLP